MRYNDLLMLCYAVLHRCLADLLGLQSLRNGSESYGDTICSLLSGRRCLSDLAAVNEANRRDSPLHPEMSAAVGALGQI